jgi:hypothetical protein
MTESDPEQTSGSIQNDSGLPQGFPHPLFSILTLR